MFVGCYKQSAPTPEDEIVFRSSGPVFGTKATPVSSLASFYVSAVTGSAGADVEAWTSATFSQVATNTYRGGKYWPASDPAYRFYASNVAMNYASDGPTIAASNETDIVCAYLSSPSYRVSNDLTFNHIFARLGAVTVSADVTYTISDITIWIRNLKTGGTYNLYTGAGYTDGTGWSSLTPAGSSDTQVYRYAGSINPGASQAGADNALYVVPGEYAIVASWTAQYHNYVEQFDQVVSYTPVSLLAGAVSSLSVILSSNAIIVSVDASLEDTDWLYAAEFDASVEDTDWTLAQGGDGSDIFWSLPGFGGPFTYNDTEYYISQGNMHYINSGYTLFPDWTGGLDMYNESFLDIISYYWNWSTLAELFDTSINKDANESIDNDKTPIPGCKLPTSAQWAAFTTGTARMGSSVNGTEGCRYALIQLTGSSHGNISNPIGLLLLPDGRTMTGMARTFTWNTPSTTGNTDVTEEQLEEYIKRDCVFLPGAGLYNDYNTSFQGGGSEGFYMTASAEDESTARYLDFVSNTIYTGIPYSKSTLLGSVRLIRELN